MAIIPAGAMQRRLKKPQPKVSGKPKAPAKGKGNFKGKGKKAPAASGTPDVNSYLAGDSDYQNTLNDLKKNFESLQSSNNFNRGALQADFTTTKDRLGKDQGRSLKQLQNDFAARGLFGSGEWMNTLNDFNQSYADQTTDAQTSFDRGNTQLLTDLADAQRFQDQGIADARLEAIRRRAEKFGLR